MAARGAERNLRGVDGDVLRLFLQKSVEQESKFEFHPFRGAGLLDLLRSCPPEANGVVQDPADQSGLAMIDMADEDDLEARRFLAHMKPFARSFCMALRS